MAGEDKPLAELLEHLQLLASSTLSLWDLPAGASARLINISENATYLVEAYGGYKSILRIHRKNYHSRRSIECELAWLDALRSQNVVATPGYFIGLNGYAIQEATVPELDGPRFLVLFHFIEGTSPNESSDMTNEYAKLGSIAARCHKHAIQWNKPAPFERLTWDVDAVFGSNPTWGDWRDGPEVTHDVSVVLVNVQYAIQTRLASYGKEPERFNLIHADMRLANILIDDLGTRLIDFDDCGDGWLMYDFAASISFIENDPRIPDLKKAWLKGYRAVRDLPAADENEIETLIMLRRMALLAWIGSHIDAPEAQALAPGFAASTARLGQLWLNRLKA